eukprot:3865139-Rhodomonas_salina.1
MVHFQEETDRLVVVRRLKDSGVADRPHPRSATVLSDPRFQMPETDPAFGAAACTACHEPKVTRMAAGNATPCRARPCPVLT